MKLQKLVKGVVLPVLLLSFGLNSCKKSNSKEENAKDGPAKVIVNMLGVDEISDIIVPNSTGNGKLAVNSGRIQEVVVPFNKDISIVATLVPENMQNNRISAVKPPTTAAIIQNPLEDDVKYRVHAYNSAGTLVGTKDYAYGNESAVGGFELNAGESYTFVAYSVNSITGTLPSISSGASLSTAFLDNISSDLMYFSETMVLSYGNNNLDIVLKHKHAQVTTNIILDDTMAGNIEAISGVQFSGATKFNADMKLSNGVISYPPASTPNQITTSFTGLPARSISSGPIIVISSSAAGTLSIGSLTIGGIVKTGGMSFTGLNLSPGVKYNLNITLTRNCGGIVFLVPSTAELTTTTPAAGVTSVTTEYAYPYNPNRSPVSRVVLYVKQLDESFSMTINGIPLLSGPDNEFRFNPVNTPVAGILAPNVELYGPGGTSGGRYGVGAISRIEAIGSAAFQIDLLTGGTPSGLMTGSFGQLQFIPTSGYSFNTAAISGWNQTGTNTVRITQKVIGATTRINAGIAVIPVCPTN